jgi:BirA family biotin operon repressor/biotin-[acetyl-CoA-carboxylase] ligase
MGINVNMTQVELQQHFGRIAQPATSLRVSSGRRFCREALLAALMQNLEHWYNRFIAHGDTVVHEAWDTRSVMRGRRINASTAATTWQGTAEGIDSAGRLRLRQDNGSLVTLSSAEVRFLD